MDIDLRPGDLHWLGKWESESQRDFGPVAQSEMGVGRASRRVAPGNADLTPPYELAGFVQQFHDRTDSLARTGHRELDPVTRVRRVAKYTAGK